MKSLFFIIMLLFIGGCHSDFSETHVTENEAVLMCMKNPNMIQNKISSIARRLEKNKPNNVMISKTKQQVINVLTAKNSYPFKYTEARYYLHDKSSKYVTHVIKESSSLLGWYPSTRYYSWKAYQKKIIINALRELVILKSYGDKKSNSSGKAGSGLLLASADWSSNSEESQVRGTRLESKYIQHDLYVSGIIAEIKAW